MKTKKKTVNSQVAGRQLWAALVLVGTVMLMCSAASAETYYVSLTGDDASDGKAEKTAFRTIKKGVSILQAGDTLIIKSGDYGDEQANLTNSGTKDAPITIKAEKPGEVVLTGNRRGVGLTMIDKSHVVVEGLKFTRYGAGLVIKHRSSYVTVRKCIFLNNENAGIVLNDGGLRDPKLSHHHLFTENQFLDPAPSTQDYGLRMYFSSNVEVVNNYFHGMHHQCISFKEIMVDSRAANNVFEGFALSAIYLGQNTDSEKAGDVRSRNLVAEGNTFRPAPGIRAKAAVVVANVTNATVRNNFMDSLYGEDEPSEKFLPGAGIQVHSIAVGTKIYGNVIVNVKEPKAAMLIRADCEIYNNTIAGCDRALEIAEGVGAVVKNNIFYKNGKPLGAAAPLVPLYDKYFNYMMKDGVMAKVSFDSSRKSVFERNLWFPDREGKGANEISADPRFVGPISPLEEKAASPKFAPDFTRAKAYSLANDSPCKGMGAFELGAK